MSREFQVLMRELLILKGGLKDWQRGPDRADHQMKVSTTSINIVIIFRGEMFRAGTHCTQTGQVH